MSNIGILTSIARTATRIQQSVYLAGVGKDAIVNALAMQAADSGSGENAEVEWLLIHPQIREWLGERQSQKVFGEVFSILLKKYEMTYEFKRDDIENGNALARVPEVFASMVNGWLEGRAQLVARELSNGATNLCYDGQPLYDTAHPDPVNEGATFSNLVATPSRSDVANPTSAEAAAELARAQELLLRNGILRKDALVSSKQLQGNLTVICRSQGVFSGYVDLQNNEKLSNDVMNRFRGTFELLYAPNDTAGATNHVDFISSVPGGPRPVFLIERRAPTPVEFDLTRAFSHDTQRFGSSARWATAPAFWQATARITDS